MHTKHFHRTLRTVLVLVLVIAAGIMGALFLRMSIRRRSIDFASGTTYSGVNVSGLSAGEAISAVRDALLDRKVTIYEKGNEQMSATLRELGYYIDNDALMKDIENAIADSNDGGLFSDSGQKTFYYEGGLTLDEDIFNSHVCAASFKDARIPTQDATIVYDGSQYVISMEVYGTDFDDADLQSYVKKQIAQALETTDGDISIELPESIYKQPSVLSSDSGLTAELALVNQYASSSITYDFGSEHVTLDWDTIQDWIVIDGANAYISAEKLNEYVADLAEKYDTLNKSRSFITTYGTQVWMDINLFGYEIDQYAEAQQLLADIQSNTAVEREPVYSSRGYQRLGTDDVVGTYIEVDLTAQHLWMYKDYGLVIETDVVTGDPKKEETVTGCYPIAYKVSPFNLVGGGGSGSAAWDVEVQYWMPFCDGQGLHDASWRSSFGGSIYQTNGSHGCVNLPPYAAATIYSYAAANMPIFLYKS